MLVLAPEIVEMVGIAGGMLILAAWAFETIYIMKEHKKLIRLQFSAVSLLGAILLAFYSIMLDLAIFVWLNITIAAIIIFEILYSLHVLKIHKK